MGKKKSSPALRKFAAFLAAIRKPLLVLLFLATLGVSAAYGFYRLRQHVEHTLAFPQTAPKLVMKDRPAWMSEGLAQRILDSAQPRGTRSALDHQLVKDVADVLQFNPWVRHVNKVRRLFTKSPGDTVEVDCDYRAPMALVPYRNQYILVDADGYKLPERFPAAQPPRIMFGPDGNLNLRIIQGVAAMPPFPDGQKWVGDDLQAGLDLVKLLYAKPFAEEIHRVNVANFRGRQKPREAQLVLITKYGSEIRWGAPVRSTPNFELPPAEKLHRLAVIYARFHRIDAHRSWLDIRFDKITQPAEEDTVVQADRPTRR